MHDTFFEQHKKFNLLLKDSSKSTHTCESRMTINKANCGCGHIMSALHSWRQEPLKSLQYIVETFYTMHFLFNSKGPPEKIDLI